MDSKHSKPTFSARPQPAAPTITEKFNKRFLIDSGLRPGYDESKPPYQVSDVITCYMEWQAQRVRSAEPSFAGVVTQTNFVYALKDGDRVNGTHEPAVRIEGEITKEYHGAIFDDDEAILTAIFDLATHVGRLTEQLRVHVFFNERFFVLDLPGPQPS